MKKVVVVGGGSGIFNVLKGLKKHPISITSIVTTFDSGGSAGKLRDEFGILPPGDIRRSLVALAPDGGDHTLRDLFSFRFPEESSLHGHSFGNLFLQALTELSGNELEAIKKASYILGIDHTILPISLDKAHLVAELADGTIVRGETNIDIPKHDGSIPIKKLFLDPGATLCPEARKAIEEADLIIIGPGDLYTSLLPHTLVSGFNEAVGNSHGKVAYIVNTMTKWGETHNFTVSDFVRTILSHLKRERLDYLMCNSTPLKPEIIERYQKTRSYPVPLHREELEEFAHTVIMGDLLTQTDVVRHDAEKVAGVIMNILEQ